MVSRNHSCFERKKERNMGQESKLMNDPSVPYQPSKFRRRFNLCGKRRGETRLVFALNCSSLTSWTTTMSFLPPPPPGMPMPPPGMPPLPPGMPPAAPGDPSSSRLPPEVLSLKSQKWIQMQKKRYGQKRRGGFVDMGKQVRYNTKSRCFQVPEWWRFSVGHAC